jgi:hypothetical protein
MGTDIVFNVHRILVTLQNEMFEKSFHNGVYKGSYMGRNEFIKKEHTIDGNSKAAFVMEAMLQYTLEKGPILKGDNSFLQFLPGNTSMDVHDEINEFGFGLNDHFIDDIQGGMQITATEEFGHGTATTGFLSQNSIGYENFLSTENNAHEKGDDLWNLVQSTMSTIRTADQRKKFASILRKFSMETIAENNPHYSKSNRGTTMLGCDVSGKPESSKRIRQHYER